MTDINAPVISCPQTEAFCRQKLFADRSFLQTETFCRQKLFADGNFLQTEALPGAGKNLEVCMKRVLLKLSGEALAGEKKTGFDESTVKSVAGQVKKVIEGGCEVAIVIGGGNFWRGRSSEAIDRTKVDQIGMLATVMNCIYVSEIFRSAGIPTEIMTPFSVGAFTELFSKDRATEAMKEGKVVFLAGGTGHPYFSTDTATVLRAIEIEAEMILLAKSVDGVYDSDPKTNPEARKYSEISIKDIVSGGLGVVDGTAAILAMENKMPMLVFGLNEKDSIVNAANGIINGTRVTV